MRILHVNKFLYRRGGAEAYAEDVAALQAAAGHVVAFWGMAHPENVHLELEATFAPHRELEPPPPGVVAQAQAAASMVWSRAAARGMAAAIRSFRPDVAHLHNIYHQLSPSILRPLRDAGVPIVLTVHDYKLVCPTYNMLAGGEVCDDCVGHGTWHAVRRRCKGGSRAASGVLAIESAIHRATRAYGPVGLFICPSRFSQAQLLRGGFRPDRLQLVHHGVDARSMPPKSTPGGDVLVAGRLSREKGVDVAVRAIGLLDGAILHVAGDGPERRSLEALAASVAPGRVRFHGRLPRADLLELLRTCAVTVLPSRCNENQPLTVLESLGCGVPAIGTRLGGTPELIRPGVDGTVVEPDDPQGLADAIRPYLDDPVRAFEMGQAGREHVLAAFDPDDHLAALDGCYASAAR